MAGQLRVDEITNEAGTGSPSFPNQITPASLGTGTPSSANFLRGDGAWEAVPPGSTPGQLQLLREDIFTTSGTWTKASGFDPDDTVMIFLVGGGGGGGATRLSSTITHGFASGGVCGSCVILNGRYGDLTSTSWTLTVGAGGAAVSATTDAEEVQGNPGGDTTFTNATTVSSFTARQGIAGESQNGSSEVRIRTFNNRFDGTRPSPVCLASFTGFSRVEIDITFGTQFTDNFPMADNAGPPFAFGGSMPAKSTGDRVLGERFFGIPSRQVFNSGGSAARQGATNRASWNQVAPALFNHSGNGSGTANGQNATNVGGGGGGCVRPAGTTATSGAGFAGGMVVRYYRGRVSPMLLIGGGA
jgi:hypothetical protein